MHLLSRHFPARGWGGVGVGEGGGGGNLACSCERTKSDVIQISDFRFQIPNGPTPRRRNIEGNRIQNEQNTSQRSTSDFCRAQISDFRFQNAVRARETSGTDFRKQKTENKRAGLDFKGVKISDSRFRSGAARCGMFSADFRFQTSRLPGAQASLVSQCHISESTNQVPYAKKCR